MFERSVFIGLLTGFDSILAISLIADWVKCRFMGDMPAATSTTVVPAVVGRNRQRQCLTLYCWKSACMFAALLYDGSIIHNWLNQWVEHSDQLGSRAFEIPFTSWITLYELVAFLDATLMCFLYISCSSKVMSRVFGVGLYGRTVPSSSNLGFFTEYCSFCYNLWAEKYTYSSGTSLYWYL